MWRAFIRGERGSVSAVSITLLLAALILLMVIIDREWINYTLKLAEQTADFAAEAGARSHEVYTTIEVTRYHYVWIERDKVCTIDPVTGVETCTDPSDWSAPIHDIAPIPKTRERELINTWKQLAHCGNPHWEGGREEYACTAVNVLAREVEFPEATQLIGQDTFLVNWTDRSSAMLTHIDVTPIADIPGADPGKKRSVIVTVDLDVRSLFGFLHWRRQTEVVGRAVVSLSPLNIRP